jgi:hypothetical protein
MVNGDMKEMNEFTKLKSIIFLKGLRKTKGKYHLGLGDFKLRPYLQK